MTRALAWPSRPGLRRPGPELYLAAGAAVVASAVALSACGGAPTAASSPATTKATTATTAASGASRSAATSRPAGAPSGPGAASGSAGSAPRGGAFSGPAASGTIASVSGSTLEVQNAQTGQTTVNVTAKTLITATSLVKVSAVKPGECVTATGTDGTGGGMLASAVSIVAPRNGSCSVFGNGGADGLGRRGEGQPARSPGGPAALGGVSRSLPRAPVNAATAFGKVVSVSGKTIDVSGTLRAFRATQGPSQVTTTTKPTTGTVTLTVSSATRYEKVGPATVASLKVGECATAFGAANSIGAVTATRLAVAPATAGVCAAGFGPGAGFGFFGGRPGGASPSGVAPGAAAAHAGTQVGAGAA